jgi:hypothetical protein
MTHIKQKIHIDRCGFFVFLNLKRSFKDSVENEEYNTGCCDFLFAGAVLFWMDGVNPV